MVGLIRYVTPNIYQGYASTDGGSVSLLLPEDQLRKKGSSGKLIWAAEALIADEAGHPPRRVWAIECKSAGC